VALASGQGKVRHVRVRKGYPESGSNEGAQANKGKSFAPRRDTVTQTKVGIEIAEILATVSVVPASVIYKSLTFSSSNTVQTHPSSQILIMQAILASSSSTPALMSHSTTTAAQPQATPSPSSQLHHGSTPQIRHDRPLPCRRLASLGAPASSGTTARR
jgi:hypothetical protein